MLFFVSPLGSSQRSIKNDTHILVFSIQTKDNHIVNLNYVNYISIILCLI